MEEHGELSAGSEDRETALSSGKTLGNEATVTFASLGKQVKGKVDTGATTSSLHAERITINKSNNSVSFSCPELSNGIITMPLDGAQEVVSADAGGTTRPIVKFDVEVDGTPIKSASFNLNDRSEMDSPILIGQNILKSGGFVIDVNKDSAPERAEAVQHDKVQRDANVLEALQVLKDNDVSLQELVEYLHTIAVNRVKGE